MKFRHLEERPTILVVEDQVQLRDKNERRPIDSAVRQRKRPALGTRAGSMARHGAGLKD
jgi:hypothetical protein